jgi:hypothetical protein
MAARPQKRIKTRRSADENLVVGIQATAAANGLAVVPRTTGPTASAPPPGPTSPPLSLSLFFPPRKRENVSGTEPRVAVKTPAPHPRARRVSELNCRPPTGASIPLPNLPAGRRFPFSFFLFSRLRHSAAEIDLFTRRGIAEQLLLMARRS